MRTLSQEHEDDVAARLREGGLPANKQPGSGNKADRPNDIYVRDYFMLECKATEGKQLTVKHAWLRRVRDLALGFKLPGIMALRFRYRHQNRQYRDDYVVLPMDYFMHLMELERECINVSLQS